MIPFDDELRRAQRRRVHRATCSSARSAPGRSRSARTSASATGRRATRRCWPPTRASSTVVHPLLRGRRRDRLLEPHPRARARRRGQPRPTACSGRRFELRGEVVHGDERGRELGFPTANLDPRRGARRARATASTPPVPTASARRRPSASACARPSQTGRGELIEAYILDFDGDLYGSTLRSSSSSACAASGASRTPQALIEQMHRDVERTREIAGAHLTGAGVCYRASL